MALLALYVFVVPASSAVGPPGGVVELNAADVNDLKRRIRALRVTGTHVPVPWFLDVDGVLNVIGSRPVGRDTWPHYERGPVSNGEGLAWPFVWAPDLMDCINLLAALGHVQVRWLTTWEYDAPRFVAPALGLQVGEWVAATDDVQRLEWWKLHAIREHMIDEPDSFFIWSDDEIAGDLRARQMTDFLPPERALVLQPDPRHGLAPSHILQMVQAIARQRS